MTSTKPLQKRNPFEYPPTTKDGQKAIDKIRLMCHEILCYIQDEIPESRDMSLGRQKLEEFELWAAKAVIFYDVK